MRVALGLALAAVTWVLPATAGAARIVALTDDGTSLIAVDTANPSVLVPPPGRASAAVVPISGIPTDETVVGIDYRPRDGALFAVTKRESAQAVAFLHRINIVAGGMDFVSADEIEAGFRTGIQTHHLFNSESGLQVLLAPFDYPESATEPRVAALAHDPVSGAVFALDDGAGNRATARRRISVRP
jgi:hypothetical protein